MKSFIILYVAVPLVLVASCVAANDKRDSYNLIAEPVAEIRQPSDGSQDKVNLEKLQSIAHNVREVRLVGQGANKREVEMKDDVGTKVMIAMDNLSKEATEVWGVINTKLDEGWTGFKNAVEEAMRPNKP